MYVFPFSVQNLGTFCAQFLIRKSKIMFRNQIMANLIHVIKHDFDFKFKFKHNMDGKSSVESMLCLITETCQSRAPK